MGASKKKKKEDLNASFSTFNEILGRRDPVHPKPRWVHRTLLTANEQRDVCPSGLPLDPEI